MPTPTEISALIDAYAEGPRLLETAVADIPEDELRFTPGPEHWSIHENIVHVADTDLVGATRIRFVLAEPGALLLPFDHERWARVMGYALQSINASLALIRAIRTTTVDVLRRAPIEAWEQTGIHPENGPQTLVWLVRHFTNHVHYHLRTIAKRRAQYSQFKDSSTAEQRTREG